MTVTCIDLEWTITRKTWLSETSGKKQDYIDNSPYYPDNKLVSAGYKTSDGEEDYLFFHHKHLLPSALPKMKVIDNKVQLQNILDKTTLLVAYHAASDLTWLRESGFTYEGRIYDPMSFEYITSYGMKTPLSLKAVLEKHKLEAKSDVLSEYFAKGKNTDEIPPDELEEYGRQDVKTLALLYNHQKTLFGLDAEKIGSTRNILRLTNDFLPVAVDMARAGIRIDTKRLLDIEKEYRSELSSINTRILEMIKESMGATPINTDSPEQLSQVFYGLKVKDKTKWAETFNIGTELKNGVNKKKHSPHFNFREFFYIIKDQTEPLYKTKAARCMDCLGNGTTLALKKDGSTGKAKRVCKACNRAGVIYTNTNEPAGFGMMPPGPEFASTGGFSAGSDAIAVLSNNPDLRPDAREFIKLIERRNAISMYLSTFVEGIQKQLHAGYLNMEYNQYVTATGRLSSRFHNLPKGRTFPIKEAIISRFDNGRILNVDFAQLEFRAAATLADDPVAILDILNKVDVHTNTAKALCDAGQDTDRDGAKAHTFKPLYGGTSGTEAEKAYYEWFLARYAKIRDWQTMLGDMALTRKYTQSPSGRIYAFPYTKRNPNNGRVSGFTQIANYQVQGFGFDIVMACIVELYNRIKHMKSKLIMTIHDSVVLDVHPDEETEIVFTVKNVLDDVRQIVYNRFSYELKLPLAYDLSIGKTWGNQHKIEI